MQHIRTKGLAKVSSLLVLAGVTFFSSCGVARLQLKTEELIALDSATGEELLFTSQARSDYLPLSIEFVTQDNLAYCGVATLVMVLNALDIKAPVAPNHTIAGLVSYRFFTQENVFENEQTHKAIAPETVARQGMTLEELGKLFQSYQLEAQTFHGEDVNLERFRQKIVQNLQQAGNFIVVNYSRRSLGQQGGGHISPVVAYHQQSDRFLILDVARYRYAPVWVKAKTLWKAINTIDSVSNKTRGFVAIELLK
ncbi:phytochelatin synthase family protein [Myxosarcina sp. GI1]|uniref:phytochelatin synthase family protein n=1 Tax=Myxosarcina sp. GI1 TaxID=1541065 RepID=UPI00055A8BA9|nr:phytochelatin synthase family protein [Myxosarcina sp. GI1]